MKETFTKLRKIVAPGLEAYHDDLEKYDRDILLKYDDPFIYGYRRTGTNMLVMRPMLIDWFPDMMYQPIFNPAYTVNVEEAKKVLLDELVWVTYSNPNFLHFDGITLVEKTKEEITRIWNDYVNNLK